MDELDILIGGQWRRGGGNLMHSQFPADGAINAALHAASLDDLQEAIDCADRAWREPTWRAMLPHLQRTLAVGPDQGASYFASAGIDLKAEREGWYKRIEAAKKK